jgi:hypothetical protein
MHASGENSILVQASKILSCVFPCYGVSLSIVDALKIFSLGKKWENWTCESFKWFSGAELEEIEDDVLVIWITAGKRGEVIKGETEVIIKHIASECDRFCTQKLMCILIQKVDYSKINRPTV